MMAWLHGIWFCQRLLQTHKKENNHFKIHQKSTHTLFCVCRGAMINQASSMGLVSDNASGMKQLKSYIYGAQSDLLLAVRGKVDSLMAGEYSGGSAEGICRRGQHAGAVVCMAASGVILGGAFPSEVHVYSLCLPVVPSVGHHSRSTSPSLCSSASYSLSPTSFLFSLPLSFYLVLDLPLGLLPGSSNLNLPPLTHPLSLLCWTLTLLPTVVWLLPSVPTATYIINLILP